jgi:hypothetical protein
MYFDLIAILPQFFKTDFGVKLVFRSKKEKNYVRLGNGLKKMKEWDQINF